MSLIINYINKHLMIHFSDIVKYADVVITKENDSTIVKNTQIKNNDFLNLKLGLESGNYIIKIVSEIEELIKSIIVK